MEAAAQRNENSNVYNTGRIFASDDNGESWSEIYPLTEYQPWHQVPSSV